MNYPNNINFWEHFHDDKWECKTCGTWWSSFNSAQECCMN